MWMTLLTSKYTYAALIIVGILAYYNVKILGMEVSYNSKVSEYNQLNEDYNKLEGQYDKLVIDLNTTLVVNKKNTKILKNYLNNVKQLKKHHSIITNSKNKEIKSLIDTIYNLNNPKKPDKETYGELKDCRAFISEEITNEIIDFTSVGK